ncbi:MAG TPA: TlpA disulfide reductase family protein [Candidatus Eremiobacteraceae bacterium]|nr:TlpA disulfide reductase family protein [Candidatus Eremiobacteraceae bacterium]
MSTRAERRRQTRQGQDPSGPSTGRITGIAIAVLAVIGIAIYAFWQYSHVSSSAVQAPSALPSVPPPASVGSKAIPFEVDTPLGPFTSVSLAGKPYLLEIFATWCPHCQRETKVLKAIRAAVPASKLFMVSISGSPFGQNSTVGTNVQESQADVDAFDKQFGVTWPAFYDANLTVARLWGMVGFPTIYIVDKKGIIRYYGSGDQDQARLMKGLKKAGV